jgi:hypothetical protein
MRTDESWGTGASTCSCKFGTAGDCKGATSGALGVGLLHAASSKPMLPIRRALTMAGFDAVQRGAIGSICKVIARERKCVTMVVAHSEKVTERT